MMSTAAPRSRDCRMATSSSAGQQPSPAVAQARPCFPQPNPSPPNPLTSPGPQADFHLHPHPSAPGTPFLSSTHSTRPFLNRLSVKPPANPGPQPHPRATPHLPPCSLAGFMVTACPARPRSSRAQTARSGCCHTPGPRDDVLGSQGRGQLWELFPRLPHPGNMSALGFHLKHPLLPEAPLFCELIFMGNKPSTSKPEVKCLLK